MLLEELLGLTIEVPIAVYLAFDWIVKKEKRLCTLREDKVVEVIKSSHVISWDDINYE